MGMVHKLNVGPVCNSGWRGLVCKSHSKKTGASLEVQQGCMWLANFRSIVRRWMCIQGWSELMEEIQSMDGDCFSQEESERKQSGPPQNKKRRLGGFKFYLPTPHLQMQHRVSNNALPLSIFKRAISFCINCILDSSNPRKTQLNGALSRNK
jgi:hypothetical protein